MSELFLLLVSFEFVSSHDVKGALDDFLMDIGDVDGDEADRHEEDTDEEHDEDGEIFGIGESERPIPVEEIFSDENIGTRNEGERRDENTDVSRDFEREEGE